MICLEVAIAEIFEESLIFNMPSGIYIRTDYHRKRISKAMTGMSLHKLSEGHKQKISMANKGKHRSINTQFKKGNIGENSLNWKGGKPKCLDCGNQLKNTYAKHCKKCSSTYRDFKEIGLKGLLKQQNMKEPTSIEKTIYDYLLLKGILFEKQRLINGKFIVDAYIPSLNLVIEADGKYWHTLDRVIKKDKAENAYLTKCGFDLLRLSEDEIRSGKFKERMVL